MSEEDLENLLNRHTQDLVKLVQPDTKKQYSCYVDGEEEYNAFITDLNAVGFSFYTRSAKANESSRALFSYAKKEGDLQIPFFGFPFQILKSSYMYCSMDGNYKPTTRPTVSADQQPSKKFRYSTQPTKKVGCQAIMRVKSLRIFNEERYKLASPYKRHCRSKNKILSQLAADLLSAEPPPSLIRYMIIMSAAGEHNHSVDSTNQNQRLHPRLREEIYSLVRAVPESTTKSVKAHLRGVVQGMFEGGGGKLPDPDNRCYYPIDHVIRFHVYQAHAAVDREGFDQETLATKVRAWIRAYPEDDFYLRPRTSEGGGGGGGGRRGKGETVDSSTLLFCHQTKFQRHLLRRYGDEICTLDPAYKTTKHAFPLYFLAVRTNAGDLIAGTMVVQREGAASIAEALERLKAWNPDWDPEFLLSGGSEAETEALGNAFPRSTVYASPWHRERDWDRWLEKKGNVSRRWVPAVRSAWHKVAASRTEEEYTQNLKAMYELEAFRDSPSAQGYLFVWLQNHRSWVRAFQRPDFLARFDMNNGSECQRLFAFGRAPPGQSEDRTLSGVVGAIVERALVDELERYSLANVPLDHREYAENVPEYLRDRPIPFVESVMLRHEEGRGFEPSLVNDMGEGLFVVRGGEGEDWCSVDFLEASCTCADFVSWRLPCAHMCAVFEHAEGWAFERLPEWYREHPYVTIDREFAGNVGVKIDFDPGVEEGDEKGEVVLEEKVVNSEVETLMEETRERLLGMLGYTYVEHEYDEAVRIAETVAEMDVAISGGKADGVKEEGIKVEPASPSVSSPLVKRAKREAVTGKEEEEKTTQPPDNKRNFPRLRIGRKNVGRCEVPLHQWREYVTEKTDVYPPQTADQIVVIDVSHTLEQD